MTSDSKQRGDSAVKATATPGPAHPSGSPGQEPVENRDNVGIVTPDAYPREHRQESDATGNRGKRAGAQAGAAQGSGAGAGGGGSPEDYDDDPQGGGGAANLASSSDQP